MTTNSDGSSMPGEGPRKAPVRRAIRIIGFTALCLITLFFLAVAVENWRGKRAWEQCRSELEAQGEQLDFEALAPKPVPPGENFFETPFFGVVEHLQANETRTSEPRIHLELGSGEASPPAAGGSYDKGTFEGLKGWREFYQGNTNYPQANVSLNDAEVVLVALGKYDAIIGELREASRRPYTMLPLDYSDPTRLASELLPLLARLKGPTRLFRLHACALLEAGRPGEALEDLEVCFRLEESLGSSPLLISQLVRMAITQIMIQPVWEGLAKHRWDEPQLAKLQERLATIDFLASYETAMRGERAFGNAMLEIDRDSKRELPSENQANGPEDPAMRFLKLAPKGWLYQNQVTGNRLFQDWVFPVVSPAEHRVFLDRQRELERWPQECGGGVYTVLARMLSPAISKVSTKFARSQGVMDLAVVGCALERFRLAEGHYPQNLDALVPHFIAALPPDVISGNPLKYQRDNEGRFVLYSVGLNATDDGGHIGLGKKGTVHYEQGDWVWRYPKE